MSLQYDKILKKDYGTFREALLKDFHVSIEERAEPKVVRAHRLIYSLCLWGHKIDDAPVNSAVFLSEMASDAVQFLPQSLTGYSKTAAFLTRGICENFLRHLYFTDHRIEFILDNLEPETHVSVRALWDYASLHPDVKSSQAKWPALSTLKDCYGELSRAIHASKVEHHEAKRVLADISLDFPTFERQVEVLGRVTGCVNYMMIVFQRRSFGGWDMSDRAIVLRTMPKQAREALRSL